MGTRLSALTSRRRPAPWSALVAVVVTGFATTPLPAHADPPPRFAVFGEYSLLYARFRYADLSKDAILHGGTLGVEASLKPFFGLEAEMSGQWATACVAWHGGLGPRLMAASDRIVVFGRALVGATGSHCMEGAGGWWYESAFALTFGGGADVRLHPRVALRVGGDYILGLYHPGLLQQFRFSAGLVVGVSGPPVARF
jgi:hypothetical protein